MLFFSVLSGINIINKDWLGIHDYCAFRPQGISHPGKKLAEFHIFLVAGKSSVETEVVQDSW